jgi:D-glycero-D-manno-heptose 1,7-bisphosphate phosphatase
VLTEPAWNPATGEYESPHTLADLHICPGIMEPLRRLQALGFALFIVSNQPSYAKGKTTLEDIRAIARSVEEQCQEQGIVFQETYYCYHHPQGIVPEYSGRCECRKPSPFFLLQAAERHDIDLGCSWMLGDRDSDVECGQRAGCRAILIRHPHARSHQVEGREDHAAIDLGAAAALIEARMSTEFQIGVAGK